MIKLVINSHIDYVYPRQVLLDSLNLAQFDFSEIILVLSGATTNNISVCNNITTIYSIKNNYDYNGFDVLYDYKDHNLVLNSFYLYIHDTTTVDRNFTDKIKTLETFLGNKSTDIVLISKGFHSNICLFGCDVIQNYKNNFSQFTLTKKQAVELEIEGKIIKEDKTMFGIKHFGNTTFLQERQVSSNISDIYNTGFPRHCFFYRDFGIYKWVLWGKDGDILHQNVVPINYGK